LTDNLIERQIPGERFLWYRSTHDKVVGFYRLNCQFEVIRIYGAGSKLGRDFYLYNTISNSGNFCIPADQLESFTKEMEHDFQAKNLKRGECRFLLLDVKQL